MDAGHPVPDGFVVTQEALATFIAEADLPPSIESLRSRLDVRSPMGIRCAGETIAALVGESAIPESLDIALDACPEDLGDGPVIVRSSGVGEDSADASFAGQLDSIPDVVGLGLLCGALLRVWASQWSPRALSYQLSRRVALRGMGVIVQRQIPSAVSVCRSRGAPAAQAACWSNTALALAKPRIGRENPGRLLGHDGRTRGRSRQLEGSGCSLNHCSPIGWSFSWLGRARDRRAVRIATGHRVDDRSGRHPVDPSDQTDYGLRAGAAPAEHARTCTGRTPTSTRTSRGRSHRCSIRSPAPATTTTFATSAGLSASPNVVCVRWNIPPADHRRPRRPDVLQPVQHPWRSSIGPVRRAPDASFNQFVGSGDTSTHAATTHAGRFRTLARGLGARGHRGQDDLAILFLTRRVSRFEQTVSQFASQTTPDRLKQASREELPAHFRGFIDIRNNRWKDAALADAAAHGLLRDPSAASGPNGPCSRSAIAAQQPAQGPCRTWSAEYLRSNSGNCRSSFVRTRASMTCSAIEPASPRSDSHAR